MNDLIHVSSFYSDTAGQERYRSISRIYFRGASIALLCFDVTDRKSYESCTRWLQDLKLLTSDCIIVASGNKIDLVQQRQVSYDEAQKYFSSTIPPIPYFETSSKTKEGLNELFENAAKMFIESRTSSSSSPHPQHDPVEPPSTPSQSWCVIW